MCPLHQMVKITQKQKQKIHILQRLKFELGHQNHGNLMRMLTFYALTEVRQQMRFLNLTFSLCP